MALKSGSFYSIISWGKLVRDLRDFCFASLTFILREAILLLMIKIVLNYCSNYLFSTFAKYPEFFNKSYLGGITLYNKVATIRHMLIP